MWCCVKDWLRSPSLKWVAVPSGTTRWTLKQLCYFFVCFHDGSQWCGFSITTLKSGATVNDCQLISLQQQEDVFGLCCSAPCPGSLNSAEYQSGALYKYYHLQWYSVKRNPKMNSKDWSKYLSLLCHPIKESKTNPYRLLKPKCVAFIYPFLPSWWCKFTLDEYWWGNIRSNGHIQSQATSGASKASGSDECSSNRSVNRLAKQMAKHSINIDLR